METRIGKIEEKNLLQARNKATYATFKIEGMNYNTFDKAIIDGFTIGDYVEFDGEENEKGFWTLKAMRKFNRDAPVENERKFREAIETIAGPKVFPPKNGKEFHLSPEEVKCRALEAASQFMLELSGKGVVGTTPESIMELADRFVEWIRDGN